MYEYVVTRESVFHKNVEAESRKDIYVIV